MLYNFALVSAIQQCESMWISHIMYTYVPSLWSPPLTQPPAIPSLFIITRHWAELPVLNNNFPLAIDFTHGSIYIYQCYCLNSSHLSILLYVHSLFSISASPFFFYCGFFPVLLKCNWQINIISIYVYHIVHLKLTQWRVDYISINLGGNCVYLDFLTIFHSFLPPASNYWASTQWK